LTWTTAGLALAAAALSLAAETVSGGDGKEPAFLGWAAAPPMGWNSWDAFGTTITSAQAKGH
jgi:hypothetical protein